MAAAESTECSAESVVRIDQPRETASAAPGGPNAVLGRQPTDSMIYRLVSKGTIEVRILERQCEAADQVWAL